ncbi:cell surface protein [Apibacter sp. HY039]|uniref:cell surface protein n=1 Tax=Apibacter sp. HY039 TaxID=2501476 RepID=UPI000FEB7E80|nr:cell surface protein [Apibacter sp. HY039]
MKKIIYIFNFTLLLASTISCSGDDSSDTEQTENIGINDSYSVNRLKLLTLSPQSTAESPTTFEWIIQSKTTLKDSVNIKNQQLEFLALYTGVYPVILKITRGNDVFTKQIYIYVTLETPSYSRYISKVYDFFPAVGQFTNTLPEWIAGDSRETMIKKADQTLTGPNPGMISLGGFGGYVIFGFDHTIINIKGKKDFKVLGNAFWSNALPNERGGSSEPGIIMVSYDKNKNGIPDDDWFEIAGSEYYKQETIKNYSLTYYQPQKPETAEVNPTYIKWMDNQGNKGFKTKNQFHSQSYYPEWVNSSSLTYTGTKLQDNYYDLSGNGTNWIGKSYEFGYADNVPNDDDASNIDIDWAVDKYGNKVSLPGIDFIKVYTGVNQEAGNLGEVSTEVTGAYDLHIK